MLIPSLAVHHCSILYHICFLKELAEQERVSRFEDLVNKLSLSQEEQASFFISFFPPLEELLM